MKRAVLLAVGFLIGFLLTYLAVKDRDFPLVVRDTASASDSQSPPAETERIAQLERELEADPDNLQSLVDLADLYLTVGGYERAANLLERAAEISPDDPDLKSDLGMALYNSGQVMEAVAQFQETLAIQPSHPQTLFNMGVVMLQELNDPEGAIEYWERMIELNPAHPQVPLVREQIELLKSRL